MRLELANGGQAMADGDGQPPIWTSSSFAKIALIGTSRGER
jgi:hypothetical protein